MHVLPILLKARGVSVHCQDADGFTPIFHAAMWGHREVMDALIAAGASVSIEGVHGEWSPITIASAEGHSLAVEALLAAGASVNAVNDSHWSAIRNASFQGHSLVVINDTEVNGGSDGGGPIFGASQQGRILVVDALIAAGASVNAVNHSDQSSAITAASANGHYLVVDALIAASASVDPVTNQGMPSLMLASQNRHVRIVEALIAASVSVNAVCNDGRSAITFALLPRHLLQPQAWVTFVAHEQDLIVDALIAAGAFRQ